ncbi:MAG: hypothetical protein KAT46_05360 [Deltaproteobacteria bacterium]|nr:hypothetical protein [Deltaproteobacteria bacterium]
MTDNKDDIKAQVDERVTSEALTLVKDNPPKKENADGKTSEFIEKCLKDNFRGDAVLFLRVFKNQFLYDKTAHPDFAWYYWKGHSWELDLENRAHEAIESLATLYEGEGEKLLSEIGDAKKNDNEKLEKRLQKKQGAFFSRARRMRDPVGIGKCLKMTHHIKGGFGFIGEKFDRDPWLLGFANGVMNLKTGVFRDGKPDDYITKAVPHEWGDHDSKAPMWEKFILEILDNDKELAAFLQRILGYGLTGVVDEHAFLILHGKQGRNGKGTLIETLTYLFPTLALPIKSELLLAQPIARSSAGHDADIMTLKGLRMALASETDDKRGFSAERIKWLTGGDTIIARGVHGKFEEHFPPTHLLILQTNKLPEAPSDDEAFWDRMNVISFKLRFMAKPEGKNQRPRIKGLGKKLLEETRGILAWLVKGCMLWQNQGLNPPPAVTEATKEYKYNQDSLSQFIEDSCIEPEKTGPKERVQLKVIYKALTAWMIEAYPSRYKKFLPSNNKFSAWLSERFDKETTGGQVYFYGIKLKEEEAGQERIL